MIPAIAGALPGIASAIGGLFQKDLPNPYDSAKPYFDQATQQMPGYYQPYLQAGQQALPSLQQNYGQLLGNPGQFMNQMGQNFHQSPGFQFQTQQALNSANRAAAAGGMIGSPMEQQNIATTTNQLANQDYYNWMQHTMGLYGMGLQGQQGLYNTGAQASNNLATNMGQLAMGQGQAAYAGQMAQNQQQGGGIGSMISGIANSLGSLFGG